MKTILNDTWKSFGKAQKYWYLIIPAAICLAYLVGLFFLTNPYGLYSVRKKILNFALVPFFYLGFSFVVGYFFIPQLNKTKMAIKDWGVLSIWSAAVAIVFFILFPNPLPLLSQNHTLTIQATGSHNKLSQGAVIEIRQMKSMDGLPFSWDKLKMDGDWQLKENVLISLKGGPDAVVEYAGTVQGGLVLSLRYMEGAGQVRIIWDGVSHEVDLFTTRGIIKDYELPGFSWAQTTLTETALIQLTHIFYFGGLFSLIMILGLIIRLNIVGQRLGFFLLVVSFAVIVVFFLNEKFSYAEFNAIQPYFDSKSYVEVADSPLTSPAFWAGQRSFTLPLVYKLLNVHTADDWNQTVMGRVSSMQIWLSIICWIVLASVVALITRQKWLKPIAFGIILLFGLNLEIGIWDRLMLSESLSFSLFALLIAIWLLCCSLQNHLLNFRNKKLHWAVKSILLIGLIILTVLFSFLRDIHAYFMLMVAMMIGLGLIFKKINPGWQKYYLFYAIAIVIMVFFQNLSLAAGKRWEVPTYNILAQWILHDDQARNYFAQNGLPVSDQLISITQMSVTQYTDLIKYDLEFAPVQQWIEQKFRSTYLSYLLSNLGSTLAAPIQKIQILVDAGALRYHSSIYPARPFSDDLLFITRLAYVRVPWIELLAIILLVIGCIAYWFQKPPANSVWLVLSILIASIYPLMIVVWFADPAEPQRHALQIGIQFRLAGWIGLVIGIDWISQKVFSFQNELRAEKKL